MGTCGGERHVEKAGTQIVIFDRRALAVEPWAEDDSAATWRNCSGLERELVVTGVGAGVGDDRVAQPPQRCAAGVVVVGDEI